MRGDAVGHGFDGKGGAGFAHPLCGSLGNLEHGEEVHAVDVFVFDAVGVEFCGEVGHHRGALDAGAHPVVVVLQDEEGRVHAVAAPEPGQICRLVEGTVVDGAVTQVELDDAVRLLVAQGVGHTDPERDMPADDAVATPQPVLDVEQVHRAALALHQTRALAVQLGHHLVGVTAEQERVGVVPVGGDDLV